MATVELIDGKLYDRLEGAEVLKALGEGKKLLEPKEGILLTLGELSKTVLRSTPDEQSYRWVESDCNVSHLVKNTFYVERPFNVREVMRHRPNEWVGMLEKNGELYKVAFDEWRFKAVRAPIHAVVPRDFVSSQVEDITAVDLNAVIELSEEDAE